MLVTLSLFDDGDAYDRLLAVPPDGELDGGCAAERLPRRGEIVGFLDGESVHELDHVADPHAAVLEGRVHLEDFPAEKAPARPDRPDLHAPEKRPGPGIER